MMRSPLLALVLLAPLAAASVDPPHPLLPASACREAAAPEPCVPWSRLGSGDGCREAWGSWILEDQAALDAFWAGVITWEGQPCSGQPSLPELRGIAWEREAVVAVVDTWGDWVGTIEVVEIARDQEGGVAVTYAITVAPSLHQIGFIVDQPFDLVAVPRDALTGPVTFVGPYGPTFPEH